MLLTLVLISYNLGGFYIFVDLLFGFTIILENGWNNTFIYPIGPLGFLIIYHVIGFIILVLPDNFEENIIKKGYFDLQYTLLITNFA
jgi:hypothetical protein